MGNICADAPFVFAEPLADLDGRYATLCQEYFCIFESVLKQVQYIVLKGKNNVIFWTLIQAECS